MTTEQTTEQQPQQNGLGTAGAVTGVFALALAVFVPALGFVLAICTVVLSWVGVTKVERGLADNKVAALAGLGLGLAAIVVQLILFTAV